MKKTLVFRFDNPDTAEILSAHIQNKLFTYGYRWALNSTLFYPQCGAICLGYYANEIPALTRGSTFWVKELVCDGGTLYSDSLPQEHNVKGFLEAAEAFIKASSCVSVRLNDEHTADVFKDRVVVGCQTFSIESIKQVYTEIVKHEARV